MPSRAAKKSPRPPGKAYFNRELSWLAFNRRVLDLAQSDKLPLLERLRFLSIVSSNLDEFFEIRVAGLIQQVDSGVVEVGLDGLGPKEQLRRIHSITGSLVADQYSCWHEQLVPALRNENVFFKTQTELTPEELQWIEGYFEEQVYPVLTPLAIDPAHPFPQLTNKALNILVWLDNPRTPEIEHMMAVIPVPRILPRVLRIETGSSENSYVFLSDIVRMFAHRLFPGYTVRGAWGFRITRNSDLYIDEEEADNLLRKIEEELHKIRRGAAVRLEIREGVNEQLLANLLKAIHLPEEYVFRVNGPINLLRLTSVYDLVDRPDHKFKPFLSYTPPALARPPQIFESIRQEDQLLHHPYDSFAPIVDFIREAARDPHVFAIKQTLYRTSGDSPIVAALKEASDNGKQVTALIEIKARFDEANNIQWARELEEAGVHVVYGLVGLKTHCKACLVVRQEKDGLRRYAHLGTGNYNPKTARAYTDFSLFTARPDLTEEVAQLFNTLTGFALSPQFEKLLVAPFNLHVGLLERIRREAKAAAEGKPARIIAKINSLIDQPTIDQLYEASQAGVQIDLIVRGICGLVPGVKGLSETIRVRSIVGRFLEHSRVYYFENAEGTEPELFLGSADWMPRNLYRRVEAVFPVMEPKLRRFLIDEVLPAYLRDNQYTTQLLNNGAYQPVQMARDEEPFSVQDWLLERSDRLRAQDLVRRAPKKKDTPIIVVHGRPARVPVPQDERPAETEDVT